MKKLNRQQALIIIIYLAFISLGLPDGVLGVAWPFIRLDMGMSLESVGILTTILLCMSAFSSIMSGRVLEKWGTGKVTFVSGLMTGCALLGYSFSPNFLWIILFVVPLGLGQGAVDSGLNLYVAENYSARHMNWLHCFWGIGASLGPLIMTKILSADGGWRSGYKTVGVIQIFLTVVLFISIIKGMWSNTHSKIEYNSVEQIGGNGNHLLADIPAQFLAVFLFFLYSGIEFSMGIWINSVLVESRDMPIFFGGICVTVFYASIMTGRFFSGMIVNKVGNGNMIRFGMIMAAVGGICMGISYGYVGIMLGVILMGVGLAPVYPCLIYETPLRFKKDVSNKLIGYQVGAACLGGSIVSAATGLMLSHFTLELLFPILSILLLIAFAVNEMLCYKRRLLD